MTTPDVYLLIHTFKSGDSVSTIHYTPTGDQPFPDIVKVATEVLGDLFDPAAGECVELIAVESDPDYEFLPEDSAGSKVFVDFYQGDAKA